MLAASIVGKSSTRPADMCIYACVYVVTFTYDIHMHMHCIQSLLHAFKTVYAHISLSDTGRNRRNQIEGYVVGMLGGTLEICRGVLGRQ